MHIRTAVAATVIAAIALTACSASEDVVGSDTATASATHTPDPAYSDAMKAADIPPEPTGAAREKLLKALSAVNPDIVRYEGKAIDAARNQCHSINDGGQNLDRSAAARFTYKDVTTTEAQGKQLNDALKASGFCKV